MTRLSYIFLFFLFLAVYLLGGKIGVFAHTNPVEMDTTAYLDAAYQIRETGGILNFIPNCIKGVYHEATQHPIYLLILSPFAKKDISFFVQAKVATFALGFLLLLASMGVTRSLFGDKASLWSAAFLIFAATFIHLSTMVACETVFALFFVLFWYCTVRGFENPKLWIWAGLFASLTFLSKSLGILTLPIFVISAVVARWRSKGPWKEREFWAFFGLFFLVASPLLIRNLVVFGSLLYSDSSAVLWLDRWHDYLSPETKTNPPTLFTYLQTHSIPDIIRIFWEGILRDAKMLGDGLKPFAFWKDPIQVKTLQGFHEKTVSWQTGWAILLTALAGLGLYLRKNKPDFVVTVVSFAFIFPFVGWFTKIFPGAPPTRLLYPALFLIWFYAAVAMARLINDRVSRVLLLGFGIFFLYCLSVHFPWKSVDISKSYKLSPISRLQADWIRREVRPGERVLGSTTLVAELFYYKDPVFEGVEEWPMLNTMEELKAFTGEWNIRYVFIDLATVAYRPRLFGAYYRVTPRTGLTKIAPLPDYLEEIPKGLAASSLYEIYRVQ